MKKVVKTPILVRFGECDYYQHVNNTQYMTYINVGLGDFLRQINPNLRELDFLIHIVHVSIDFKSAATFDDELEVTTEIESIGETSITFRHKIYKKADGSLCVTAKKVCAILDKSTGKKALVPQEFKELM